MSEQSDAQGEATFNPHDKEPHRKKVQISKSPELFVKKPKRLRAVVAKKHLTVFPISERRKNLPLSERSQVTMGEFVYKRSKARKGSPLYGKWYRLHKGESLEHAVLIDSLPIEEKKKKHEDAS